MSTPISLGEYLNAVCILERASKHVANQFSMRMSKQEAQDNLCTRHLLLRHRILTHNEAGAVHGLTESVITQDDIDNAIKGVSL